jgi:transcription antitermination factor NusG
LAYVKVRQKQLADIVWFGTLVVKSFAVIGSGVRCIVMEAWYVLRTKPHKETAVYRLLKSREVTVYYPTINVEPVNPRSARVRPYFPGYMFVKADLDCVGRSSLEWLPGTQGLVAFGGEAAVVPERLIEAVKKQLALGRAQGQPTACFRPGDKVRIVAGPLAGYEAIFDAELSGRQRVQVLLTYLHHQPKPIKLDKLDIAKIK